MKKTALTIFQRQLRSIAGKKGGKIRGEQMRRLSQKRSYIKQGGRHIHRIIAEKMLDRPLRKGEIVHHKDGNKLNNAPENLTVLPSQSEHARLHVSEMLAARKQKHDY